MPTTQNIICSVSRCASEMFALLLVFFFAIFFLVFILFIFVFFVFCKIKKIAQIGRDITQIIERLPKDRGCMRPPRAPPTSCWRRCANTDTHTHSHTHTLHTPYIAQFAATISIACLYVFIFHIYIYRRHDQFSPAACLFIIHKLFVDISLLLFCEFSECQTKNENGKRQGKRKTCAMAKLLLLLHL